MIIKMEIIYYFPIEVWITIGLGLIILFIWTNIMLKKGKSDIEAEIKKLSGIIETKLNGEVKSDWVVEE